MKRLIFLSCLMLIAAGCAHTQRPMAMAMMHATSGSTAVGMVHLQEMADGSVEVHAEFKGVPPGVHGFHIHEKGDCGDNGNAAGFHFNPTNMPHAAPDAASHHSGDFGNVTADAEGNVNVTFKTTSITLHEGTTNAVGHALILHANPDDLTTQPTGNAGARIACGIVEIHQASAMQH